VLGNLLLILGLSMLLGGFRFKVQKFSASAAESSSALMFLAVVGLLVPTVFHLLEKDAAIPVLRPMSVGISIVLLLLYGASLLFQLRTHAYLYAPEDGEAAEDEDRKKEPIGKALGVLVAATAAVAVVSEYLVHAIEGATKTFGFTETFVGVIVLATVGNAAEHSTAITMAMKNKMDLSFSIALESSKQIALFVAPFLVLLSTFIGEPMTIEFTGFEVAAVSLGVGGATVIALDGKSTWLEGAMLLGVYSILGIAFFFMP